MNDRFEELKQNLLPRFWDTASNDMLYPNEISTEEGDFRYLLPFMGQKNEIFYTLSEMLINPRFIPMKPTGLKDKNGKLLYEGDVLKNPDFKCLYFLFWDKNLAKFRLSWQYEEEKYNCDFQRDDRYEIIGNIHENKDLLK